MIEVGQVVGNYAVTEKLGEGGMGIVYLVEHPVIGRKAALKAVHPHFARNPMVVSRFVTEAKAVNQIGHEHIVDITDFGTTPSGDFYFIMEYLGGDSLAGALNRQAPFSPERALRIALQLADALEASHAHGVIHRDLKPDNIVLVEHGTDRDFVKVLDFGLAKLVGPDQAGMRNTQTGSVVGTPYYMSPEQCEGNREIDRRADIYSLGVVLFEMLTGKLPFGGKGYGEVLLKHMTVPAPAARSVVPSLSPALDAILYRALAKDPAERFQTMAEFHAALLDPDAYAATFTLSEVDSDLSGRRRAAAPMTRAEMQTRPTLLATLNEGAPHDPSRKSTLRDAIGEVDENDVIPRTHHARGLILAAGAALALVLIPAGAFRRPTARVVAVAQEVGHPATVRLKAAAEAFSRPASVRLNFNSDPVGASVLRADGTVLGVTPLSTNAPYADVATEYFVRKDGFLPKTVALVPNLPSPVFVVLERDPLEDPPLTARLNTASAISGAEPSPTRRLRVSHHHYLPPPLPAHDEDETLAPSPGE
jgi:eukaryotic-like serine/threonine-protein kinase